MIRRYEVPHIKFIYDDEEVQIQGKEAPIILTSSFYVSTNETLKTTLRALEEALFFIMETKENIKGG